MNPGDLADQADALIAQNERDATAAALAGGDDINLRGVPTEEKS